jgi:hypothetical protein
MFRFLVALFDFLANVLQILREQRLVEQGRKEVRQEVDDELKEAIAEHVEQAKQAAADPTPVAVERMRSRFDRSRNPTD